MRALTAEEQALWAKVTESIRPLSREPYPPRNGEGDRRAKRDGGGGAVPGSKPPPPPIVRREKGPAPRLSPSPVPARPAIANALDSSWDRRLRSGAVHPDRVVDLHGHDLEGAWQAIDQALERATVNRDRVLLLVTGHARPGDPPVARGRIRAAVHDWLAASRHREKIAAVRGAHRRHGGGGSLYVILRR